MENSTKTCFGHVGGKPGVLLMENFTDKGGWRKKHPGDAIYTAEKNQVRIRTT